MSGRRRERSAGFIVYRDSGGPRRYLLIRDRKHGNWGFPKGHLEVNEDDLAAAGREVREECGIKGLEPAAGFKEELSYRLPSGRVKTAVYFLAAMPGRQQAVPCEKEVLEITWLPLQEALELLTFDLARDLLRRADLFLKG